MGLRQPSKTGAFFAQAAAGTQQQEEARKKLKKPQALGGAASAGTEMVAAQTQAQKDVTGQVKEQTGKAATEVVAAPIKSTTAEVIATPIASTESPIPSTQLEGISRSSGFANTMRMAMAQHQKTKDLMSIDELAQAGDIAEIESRNIRHEQTINSINNQINNLNDQLKKATAADIKAINDEKTRLTNLLQSYQDKITKENLGQMAGPSAFETEMQAREQILAQRGDNVGKLAAIFGPSWSGKKRGALESQIYGKDLEAIQQQAAAGLSAKERATREGESALEGFTEQLGRSKKAFTETLDKESTKLDILKKTPEELAGYTKKELTELFGADQVKNLFSFSSDQSNATVTGTKLSSTRKELEDRLTKEKSAQEKIAGAKTTAQGVIDAKQIEAEESIFGNPSKDKPDILSSSTAGISRLLEEAKLRHAKLESIPNWQRKERHSETSSSYSDAISRGEKALKQIENLRKEADSARKTKNTAKLIEIKRNIDALGKVYSDMNKLVYYASSPY